MQLEAPANRPLVHPRTSLRASRSLEQLRCLHLAHSCKPSPDKSASKKVVTKLFILGAEPLSSVPVWAEPSQLLIGMYGPPQSCKRKTNNGIWSAPMYSALSGVTDSGP